MNFRISKLFSNLLTALCLMLVQTQNAFAAATGMPWEEPMEKIMNSISGPIAKAIAVMSIVVTGLGIAFGEGGGGMRKMLWVVFGISIAFAAAGFFMSFFGFGQGLAF